MYIFLSNLVDLARVRLVSSSVSLLIGGFLFFDLIDGRGVISRVRLNKYFRARDFVHGAGILSLQEFSGGAVLVRYVLLLPASSGLEFPVPVLRSSSSVNWGCSWRRLASDPSLRDDDVAKSGLFAGAFNVLWYGLFVAVLLLAFKRDIASSVGVSALSFLLDVLCYWQWTQASSGDSGR